MVPIKGDLQEVKKDNNRTNVVINEGVNIVNYELDSGLIEFGTAMEDGDLVRAVDYLESVPVSEETETMWKTLARVALESQQYYIAERCYAALGDVAKARFLRETNRLAADHEKAVCLILHIRHILVKLFIIRFSKHRLASVIIT